MALIRPQKLKTGDRVGIVAPAGPVDSKFLEKGIRAVRQMGFEPVLGHFINARQRFLAGTDEQRAEDLMTMFQDPDIRAIFCARGGYGVNRILSLLKPRVIRQNPKIVVGSSDISLLLWYLNQKCSLVAFHGPMVAGSFGRRSMPESKIQMQRLLAGQVSSLRLKASAAHVIRPGRAQGVLAGGCLTLLCRSLKTSYEFKTPGRILLIEDVNEKPYRIDGMLWQLRKAGKFRGVRGVVFGEMVHCHPDRNFGYSLRDVISDFFKDDDFPVMMNCPVGHGSEIWTLPLGVKVNLNTRTRSLKLAECGVI